jgi:hypothetical protein
LNADACFTCAQPRNLEDALLPYDIIYQIQDLNIHCKYGCKLVGSNWEVDPDGCPEILVKKFRNEHEALCKFNQVKCPKSDKCTVKSRQDLPRHLEEECPYHDCPHQVFGCKYQGTKKSMTKHLTDCIFEKVKTVLYSLKEQTESQQKTILSLQDQLKAKDEIIAQLQRSPTNPLANSAVSNEDHDAPLPAIEEAQNVQ